MKKKIRKDRRRRKQVDQGRQERRKRKAILVDERKSREERKQASERRRLKEGERNQSRTRIRNRCVETGNPRFVIRWFRRSGLRVRERARRGKLPGVYKISW
jgi:small subunit ribosomal protein S14